MLTEDLNAARLKAAKVEADADSALVAAARADAEAGVARARLKQHAVEAYMSGGFVSLAGGLNLDDASDVAASQHYLGVIVREQLSAIDALRVAKLEAEEKRAALTQAMAAAREAVAAVEARRTAAAAAVSVERDTLARVRGELGALVDAERQRRAAAEERKAREELAARDAAESARRRNTTTTARSGSPARPTPTTVKPGAPTSPPPPTPAGAAGAVEEAKKHVGKPYEYGGSGPDTFDCSGLTSYAWRHGGGKSLPHSSRAQYSATARVSVDDVAIGDLLFYGPNVEGIHHVGIYVGNGQMVEAPETGKNVRYGSIYRRDLVGVGRVR